MPLSQAMGHIPAGVRPDVGSVRRWATRGVLAGGTGPRVYLRLRRVGGRLCCTREDVEKFLVAVSARGKSREPVVV